MHTYPVAPEEEMVTVYMYTVPGRLHTCTGGGAALCADLCEAGAPSSSSSSRRCAAGTSEGYGVRGLPVHLSRRRRLAASHHHHLHHSPTPSLWWSERESECLLRASKVEEEEVREEEEEVVTRQPAGTLVTMATRTA